jgi:integrase/recombinase XerD
MLPHALEAYLALRRTAGFDLGVPAILLRSYVRFAEQRGEEHVKAHTAIDWAAMAPSPGQRAHRLQTVVRFARHVRAEDPRHELPPSGTFGAHRQRRVPYIYTPIDIARLLQAASQLGPAGSLRPHMYRTLFALLAATGLRISEALRLRLDDITPDSLIIRHSKFQKSRLVPLHDTVVTGLACYLVRRQRADARDDYVFISLDLVRNKGVLTFRRMPITPFFIYG